MHKRSIKKHFQVLLEFEPVTPAIRTPGHRSYQLDYEATTRRAIHYRLVYQGHYGMNNNFRDLIWTFRSL